MLSRDRLVRVYYQFRFPLTIHHSRLCKLDTCLSPIFCEYILTAYEVPKEQILATVTLPLAMMHTRRADKFGDER